MMKLLPVYRIKVFSQNACGEASWNTFRIRLVSSFFFVGAEHFGNMEIICVTQLFWPTGLNFWGLHKKKEKQRLKLLFHGAKWLSKCIPHLFLFGI